MKYIEKHDLVMALHARDVETLEENMNAYMHCCIVDAPRHVIKARKHQLPATMKLRKNHAVFKACSNVFAVIEEDEGNTYRISTAKVESEKLVAARKVYNQRLRRKAVGYYFALMNKGVCTEVDIAELPSGFEEAV